MSTIHNTILPVAHETAQATAPSENKNIIQRVFEAVVAFFTEAITKISNALFGKKVEVINVEPETETPEMEIPVILLNTLEMDDDAFKNAFKKEFEKDSTSVRVAATAFVVASATALFYTFTSLENEPAPFFNKDLYGGVVQSSFG